MESSTAKIELLKLGEEIIGITFIIEDGEKQIFLKVDIESLKDKLGIFE